MMKSGPLLVLICLICHFGLIGQLKDNQSFMSNKIAATQNTSSYAILQSGKLTAKDYLNTPLKKDLHSLRNNHLSPFKYHAPWANNPRSLLSLEADSVDQKWYKSRAFNIAIAPTLLIGTGLATWNKREDWRYLRNRFIPQFEDRSDDWVQYIPGLMVYGLNLAGVKGKHSIKRATTSLAIGGGMAGLLVLLGKNTANVERPDGSNTKSFPSGHTTTAFTLATFLHKEYGHISPFYSVAGYGMATYAGIFRGLNNKHWHSDVLVGAGIGILFTNLGYILAEKIYGDREINPLPDHTYYDREKGRPSFISMRMGYATATAKIDQFKDELIVKDGFTAGLQGAYFFSDHIGIGAEVSVASFILNSDNVQFEDPEVENVAERVDSQPIGSRSPMIGPFFHFPVKEDLAVTAKLVAGTSFGAAGKVYIVVKDEFQEDVGVKELPIVEYDPDNTFTWSAGVGLRKMLGRNVGLDLFTDFNYQRPDITYSEITDFNPEDGSFNKVAFQKEKAVLDYLSVGVSVSAMLW